MINKFSKLKSIAESEIIEKYLKKLNFDKRESFGFKNDSAYLNSFKNKKIIVTNDSIIENVDFFKKVNCLAPFGSGNPEPKFVIENVKSVKRAGVKDQVSDSSSGISISLSVGMLLDKPLLTSK